MEIAFSVIGIICLLVSLLADYISHKINKVELVVSVIGSGLIIVAVPFIFVETLSSFAGVIVLSIGVCLAIPICIKGLVKFFISIIKK